MIPAPQHYSAPSGRNSHCGLKVAFYLYCRRSLGLEDIQRKTFGEFLDVTIKLTDSFDETLWNSRDWGMECWSLCKRNLMHILVGIIGTSLYRPMMTSRDTQRELGGYYLLILESYKQNIVSKIHSVFEPYIQILSQPPRGWRNIRNYRSRRDCIFMKFWKTIKTSYEAR